MVYPRVCGGTRRASARVNTPPGLSPRVRGNPRGTAPGERVARSIPACAGEPELCFTGRRIRRVYPRVCGGTPLHLARQRAQSGLSPRVRGNLGLDANGVDWVRSIPACAGEPHTPAARREVPSVYPRVCGGTGHAEDSPVFLPGLSPRVRGNQPGIDIVSVAFGSIPACAGEPMSDLLTG